jgi:DNA-binding LacI/PurR family transcriptional regulator
MEIGKVAFQALWAMLRDPAAGGMEYPLGTHLVTRESSAHPRITAERQAV